MPVSPDITMIPCRWIAGYGISGAPAVGYLYISASKNRLLDASVADESVAVLFAETPFEIVPTIMTIDGDEVEVGVAEFELPATDDADLTGQPFTYQVREELTLGAGGVYNITVPAATVGTLDLSSASATLVGSAPANRTILGSDMATRATNAGAKAAMRRAETAAASAETAATEAEAFRDEIDPDQFATLDPATSRLEVTQRPYALPAPSGSDDTAAVQAVFDDAVSTGAPVIGPGDAEYLVTSVNLDDSRGVTLEFGGGAARAGSATMKRTTSGTSSVISARNSLGLTIKNLRVEYSSSSYTGRLLDLRGDTSDTGMATLENMWVGSDSSTVHTATGLDIDKSYGITGRRLHFLYNQVAVNGLTNTGYSNGILFDTCIFSNSVDHHVRNAGNGWTFLNCIGQQRIGDVGGFYGDSDLAARRASNVRFVGGWYGDVTSGTEAQIEVNGDGFALEGVYMGCGAGVGAKMMVATIYGFEIVGGSKISGSNAGVDYNSLTDGLSHHYRWYPPTTAFINGTPPRGSSWNSLTPNDGMHVARLNVHGGSNADWTSYFNSAGTQRFAVYDSGALRW